ncbi:hypothetical protein [Massilia niastensis]|uniref:hypothetical protein n=1 Tax=Massilia niastensis TaxID=544911 RepID=UPI0012EB3743|nr:hypothetical protein [Massilia niastensis]
MDAADVRDNNVPTNDLGCALVQLRNSVLAQWAARVTAEVPVTAKLGRPILIDTLPILYDSIIGALDSGEPRFFVTFKTDLITVNEQRNAEIRGYGPQDVVHELQLFREILFSTAKASGLPLGRRECEAIGHLIEEAIRESVAEFSTSNNEVSEASVARWCHDLRNPLHVANATAQLIQLKAPDPNIASLAKRICKKLAEMDAMIQALDHDKFSRRS